MKHDQSFTGGKTEKKYLPKGLSLKDLDATILFLATDA